MSAAEAYEFVSRASHFGAGEAICGRAHDGLVQARAVRMVWGDRSVDDCEVARGFWWARGEAALAQNWTTGDFETIIDQRVRYRAYGVEFALGY